MSASNKAACTIASANYLRFVMTLYDSYMRYHPGQRFFVLIVDHPAVMPQGEYPFEIVFAEELPIKNFAHVAFQFDVLELNTNVKPTFLKYLLQRRGVDQILYFDPDIFVYHALDSVFALLHENSIVLTPHCTIPIEDQQEPSEQNFLRTGVFNLGFIGLKQCKEAFLMLDWWETRCLNLGYHELATGLFVDQKWMNLIPCYFSSVHVLKHPGCNVAYWNLHERILSTNTEGKLFVNGQYPLVFFHFSGIVAEDESSLSKYQNRYTFQQRPDIVPLFDAYRGQLKKYIAGFCRAYSYSYGCFSNGKPIPALVRRLFGAWRHSLGDADPFDTDSAFYRWVVAQGLIGVAREGKKYSALTYNKSDWRLRIIHKLLRLSLRILGVYRYTLLMQYLSYIVVLRNQAVLFDGNPPFPNDKR